MSREKYAGTGVRRDAMAQKKVLGRRRDVG